MPKSHRSETYPESEKHLANVDVLLEPLKKTYILGLRDVIFDMGQSL